MQDNQSDLGFNRRSSISVDAQFMIPMHDEHRSGPCSNRSSSNSAEDVPEHCRKIKLTLHVNVQSKSNQSVKDRMLNCGAAVASRVISYQKVEIKEE